MRLFSATCGLAVAIGFVGAPESGFCQDQESPTYGVSGSYNYRTYCATCHGVDGTGDGPLAENLRFVPPDLTLMARKNGGRYPANLVARIVDGRKPVDGHGGPDMPVWGDAFKNPDTGFDNAKVQQKIRSVVDFIETLQQK
jgi:mono/diheme cytochrome c family protein